MFTRRTGGSEAFFVGTRSRARNRRSSLDSLHRPIFVAMTEIAAVTESGDAERVPEHQSDEARHMANGFRRWPRSCHPDNLTILQAD
jgi:hypothetical protein